MREIFTFFVVFLFGGILQAQTTIFTNDCSAATAEWTFTDNGGQPIQKSGYWLLDKDGKGESIISTTYDVSSYTDLILTFQIKSYGNGTHPTCTVDLSKDNGATFNAGTFTTSNTTTSLVTQTYNIGTINTTQLKIRWVRTPSSGTRGVRIDNIKLEGTLAGSVANPSNFSASAGGSDNIDLSWRQNTSHNNVMIAYNTTDAFGTPSDGTSYTVGSTLSGGGTIIYNGNGASYNHSGLSSNTAYYYKAWSVDGSNNYSSGVKTNATTAKAEPSNHVNGFNATAASSSQINLSWTENDGTVVPDGYLIKAGTSLSITDPTDGTEESDDTNLSDGSGAKNVEHGTTSYSWIGLSASTTYYFKIYPYTNSGSHIDYKTDGTVPSDSATTPEQSHEYLIISEIADPHDSSYAKFVEIYNVGNSDINLSKDKWYLSRQANGSSSSWADFQLTGTIKASEAKVIAYNQSNFNTAYGFDPDFTSGNITGNGNDGYFLYKGGNHSSGALVDAYGVIDEDGTGKPWEYKDSRAYRKSSVTQANVTWISSEWTIESANADDTTPGNYPENDDEKSVDATGEYDFTSSHTGFKMKVNSISGSDNFKVKFYKGKGPKHVGGISESHISKFGWHFTKGNGITAIDANLKFYVSDLPENSVAEGASNVKLYKRENFGKEDFSLVGTLTYHDNGTTGNQSDDWLEYDGVTGFSEYVMASNNSPLPVELKSFTAAVKGNNVEIYWVTATEVNNYGFQVQRKKLKVQSSWEEIGFIAGHGNSNSPKDYRFVDTDELRGTVKYRLKQIDIDGGFEYSDVVEVNLNSELPTKFKLTQNYPNPFNLTTVIKYSIPASTVIPNPRRGEESTKISLSGRNDNTNVTLRVYDILGREVATLVNEEQAPGNYFVKFNAENISSGIYFYILTYQKTNKLRKMLIIK